MIEKSYPSMFRDTFYVKYISFYLYYALSPISLGRTESGQIAINLNLAEIQFYKLALLFSAIS